MKVPPFITTPEETGKKRHTVCYLQLEGKLENEGRPIKHEGRVKSCNHTARWVHMAYTQVNSDILPHLFLVCGRDYCE